MESTANDRFVEIGEQLNRVREEIGRVLVG